MKETELVLVFGELMSWDYSVPDYYFDKNLMLDRKRQEQLQETYLLPTRTFWRPVYFDTFKEEDLLHPTFARKVRDFSQVPHLPSQHPLTRPNEGAQQNPLLHLEGSESERNYRPREGVYVSYLRPYDAAEKHDHIKFDKLFSKGEYHEHRELEMLKHTIEAKLSRERTDHGMRFKREDNP
jgi:hypothetical protein